MTAIDRQGRPLGTDFSNVYAAGTYVLDGNPDAPFDPPQQYAREQSIFGAATPFYGWHYPPYFLFIAGALGENALRPCTRGVAGEYARALSAGDLGDRLPALLPCSARIASVAYGRLVRLAGNR